jgi:HEAT repeat protein
MPGEWIALALILMGAPRAPGAPGAGQAGVETGDALEFSRGGMGGGEQVRWDPATARVYYESTRFGRREKWDRRPSDEEWRGFWKTMDELGVWRWKEDDGRPCAPDSGSWRVVSKHGGKSLISGGCRGPKREEWEGFQAALTGLRGGREVAGRQVLVLVKSLKESQDWNARIRTAHAIGELGPGAATAVPALVESLGWPLPSGVPATEGHDLGVFAVQALVNIGDAAVPDLVQALKDESPARRRLAADALGQIAAMRTQPTSVISALTEALQDASARQAAARALARIDSRNGPVVAPILIEGLRDRDVKVAKYSASALGEIGAVTPAVVPALGRALDDPRIQHSVLGALWKIGPDAAAAVPALVTALKDDNEAVRQAAAHALQLIGEGAKDSVPALIDALSHDRNGGVRADAARTLGAIGPPAVVAIPALVDALRHGNAGYSVAMSAVIALAQIGEPAVPALIAALYVERLGPATRMANEGYQGPIYSDLENLRVGAAEALNRIGPRAQSAIPALTDALKDEHPRVREMAAHALTQIRRP